MTLSVQDETANWVINGICVIFSIFLLISIRATRKEYFWLTPQDLLVLFFIILLAPQWPLNLGHGIRSEELIPRTALLLYACEYIILSRGDRAKKGLTNAAIFALFLLAINI